MSDASKPHSLPTVGECDERIAEAQHVLDHQDDYDIEVRVQADKDRRRWEFNRHFADRVASLEEQVQSLELACDHHKMFWQKAEERERGLKEQLQSAERRLEESVPALHREQVARRELQEQLEAVQKALRELHENMWMVSDDGGPEFISPEGLKYLRGWFERTEHLT